MPGLLNVVLRDVRSRRHVWLLAASVAWVVAASAYQWHAGRRLVVVPWLALAPLAASLALSWATTTVVAVCSVLAVYVLSARVHDAVTHQGLIRLAGSTSLAVFAAVAAEVRTRREERVRRITEVAAVAQATILHPVPATVGGFALASRYVSASRDALVGGDLYDVVGTGDGVRILLGDARGKGLAAVQTAATVLSVFRGAAPREGVPLDELARRIDAALRERQREEDFVTAVLCDLSADGSVTVVNCGHPPPLRLSPGREPQPLGRHRSPPLGLGADPVVERAILAPGDRLLFYTDGLVEARDREGEFYDLPRAATLVAPRPAGGAPESGELGLDRLMAALSDHVGGVLDDDVAVLLVEVPSVPVTAARPPGS